MAKSGSLKKRARSFAYSNDATIKTPPPPKMETTEETPDKEEKETPETPKVNNHSENQEYSPESSVKTPSVSGSEKSPEVEEEGVESDDSLESMENTPSGGKRKSPDILEPPKLKKQKRMDATKAEVMKSRKPILIPPPAVDPMKKKAAVKKPEVKKPEVKKPEVKKPEVKKPEVKQPEIQKPEVKKPTAPIPQRQCPGLFTFWTYQIQPQKVYVISLCGKCQRETGNRVKIHYPSGKQVTGIVMCKKCIDKNIAIDNVLQ